MLPPSALSVETGTTETDNDPTPLAPPDDVPLIPLADQVIPVEAPAEANCVIIGEVSNSISLDPIPNAIVELVGLGRSVETAADGSFRIEGLTPGDYSLEAVKLGYYSETTVVTTIPAEPGNARISLRVKPTDDSQVEYTLEEETIVGEYQEESGGDLFLELQIAPSVISGISREEFSTSAISDAAGAVAKISGANVIGGKYAVVRGLADRYSNTLVNGAVVSSADPSRKAVQLDLFPSDLLESLSIQKAFTPNLPADFAGGTVLIETLKIPRERMIDVSFGTKYQESLNGDFYAPPGQRLSHWGDGAEGFPSSIGQRGGSATTNPDRFPAGVTTAASPTQTPSAAQLEAREKWSALHGSGPFLPTKASHQDLYDYSLTYADTYTISGETKFGWVLALTREQGAKAEQDVQVSRLAALAGPLELYRNQVENRYIESVDWGALISGTLQLNERNTLNYTRFINRSAENEVNRIRFIQSRQTDGENIFNSAAHRHNYLGASGIAYRSSDITSYTDRNLDIQQFSGKHSIGDTLGRDRFRASWLLSDSSAEELRPDQRNLRFTTVDFTDPRLPGIIAATPSNPNNPTAPYSPEKGVVDTISNLLGGNPPSPQRQSLSTIEDGSNQRLDLEFPFYLDENEDSKRHFTLKVGSNDSERERTSRGDNYAYRVETNRPPASENIDELFQDLHNRFNDLRWILGARRPATGQAPFAAISISDITDAGTLILNSDTSVSVDARYVMGSFQWDSWNIYGGAREEQSTRYYNAQVRNDLGVNLNNATQVASIGPTEIRSSQLYPSFGVSRVFGANDQFSLVAAWSRTVARPTFLEFAPIITEDQATGEELRGNPFLRDSQIENFDLSFAWTPKPSTSLSVSLFSKDLQDPITKVLGQRASDGFFISYANAESGSIQGVEIEADHAFNENWKITGNLTYLDALLVPGKSSLPAPILADSFDGQPEWIFNLNLGYTLPDQNFTANLIYNFTGDYLAAVSGSSGVPSVVRESANTLDLVIRKGFKTPWGDSTVTFKTTNVLNDPVRFSYQGSGDNYSSFSPGRTYSLSLSSEF